jgi:hypothetical protein
MFLLDNKITIGNKINYMNIVGRVKTINGNKHCILDIKNLDVNNQNYFRKDNCEHLPFILNNLSNINYLTICIHEYLTLETLDEYLYNLCPVLKKIIFKLKFKITKEYMNGFNFIHRLKIPYGCELEFSTVNNLYKIISIVRYDYFTIRDRVNDETKIRYSEYIYQFFWLSPLFRLKVDKQVQERNNCFVKNKYIKHKVPKINSIKKNSKFRSFYR